MWQCNDLKIDICVGSSGSGSTQWFKDPAQPFRVDFTPIVIEKKSLQADE